MALVRNGRQTCRRINPLPIYSLTHSSIATGENGRKNSIGAVRLGLAGLVVYTHAFYLGGFGQEWLLGWSHGAMTAGHFAVQCFFALSGWLVAASWCRQPALGRFLWHRFLRIAPAMWACLTVTALVFTPLLWLYTNDPRTPFFSLEPSALGYIWNNLVLPRSQIAVGPFPSGGAWNGDWNGSLWTLFYEGACYLIIAALGLAGLLTRRRNVGTALIAGLLILHPVIALLPPDDAPALLRRLYDTPGKLLTLHFLAGAVWAVWPRETTALLRRNDLALLLLVTLFVSWHYPFHAWLSPFVLPFCVLTLSQHGLWANFERRVGGDYSYGLYLYAYPAQQILATFELPDRGFTAYLLGSLALGLVCAATSWHLLEKPVLSLKSATLLRLSQTKPA